MLSATSPENKDTDFTWKDFQARNNNELVAVFGNFINRVIVLTNKYWDGLVPERTNLSQYDKEVLESINMSANKIGKAIESFKLREGLNEMMSLARIGNKYLAETEPWKLIKTDEERTSTILNISLQISAALAILCEPYLPFTASKLKKLLNINLQDWNDISVDLVAANHKINKHEHLFKKIEDSEIEEQLQKLNS